MKKIVRVHPHPTLDQKLVDQAVVAFYELREVPRLRKRPSTSELIDWISTCSTTPASAANGSRRSCRCSACSLKKEQDVETVAATKKSWRS